MKNQEFESKMKQEFSKQVPDVLNKIKQSERFVVPTKEKKPFILTVFKSRGIRYSLMSSFLIVILAIFMINGNTDNQVYASTVTLDINPQIEITLDEDDRVIEVRGLNDDGVSFFQTTSNFKKMELDEFIELLVERLDERGYIVSTEDNTIMIYVEGTSDQIKERVLANVQSKILTEAQKRNRIVNFVKTNEIELTTRQVRAIKQFAENNDINPGRAILIYQIREIDDTYTIQSLQRMKMRDLNALYESLVVDE